MKEPRRVKRGEGGGKGFLGGGRGKRRKKEVQDEEIIDEDYHRQQYVKKLVQDLSDRNFKDKPFIRIHMLRAQDVTEELKRQRRQFGFKANYSGAQSTGSLKYSQGSEYSSDLKNSSKTVREDRNKFALKSLDRLLHNVHYKTKRVKELQEQWELEKVGSPTNSFVKHNALVKQYLIQNSFSPRARIQLPKIKSKFYQQSKELRQINSDLGNYLNSDF